MRDFVVKEVDKRIVIALAVTLFILALHTVSACTTSGRIISLQVSIDDPDFAQIFNGTKGIIANISYNEPYYHIWQTDLLPFTTNLGRITSLGNSLLDDQSRLIVNNTLLFNSSRYSMVYLRETVKNTGTCNIYSSFMYHYFSGYKFIPANVKTYTLFPNSYDIPSVLHPFEEYTTLPQKKNLSGLPYNASIIFSSAFRSLQKQYSIIDYAIFNKGENLTFPTESYSVTYSPPLKTGDYFNISHFIYNPDLKHNKTISYRFSLYGDWWSINRAKLLDASGTMVLEPNSSAYVNLSLVLPVEVNNTRHRKISSLDLVYLIDDYLGSIWYIARWPSWPGRNLTYVSVEFKEDTTSYGLDKLGEPVVYYDYLVRNTNLFNRTTYPNETYLVHKIWWTNGGVYDETSENLSIVLGPGSSREFRHYYKIPYFKQWNHKDITLDIYSCRNSDQNCMYKASSTPNDRPPNRLYLDFSHVLMSLDTPVIIYPNLGQSRAFIRDMLFNGYNYTLTDILNVTIYNSDVVDGNFSINYQQNYSLDPSTLTIATIFINYTGNLLDIWRKLKLTLSVYDPALNTTNYSVLWADVFVKKWTSPACNFSDLVVTGLNFNRQYMNYTGNITIDVYNNGNILSSGINLSLYYAKIYPNSSTGNFNLINSKIINLGAYELRSINMDYTPDIAGPVKFYANIDPSDLINETTSVTPNGEDNNGLVITRFINAADIATTELTALQNKSLVNISCDVLNNGTGVIYNYTIKLIINASKTAFSTIVSFNFSMLPEDSSRRVTYLWNASNQPTENVSVECRALTNYDLNYNNDNLSILYPIDMTFPVIHNFTAAPAVIQPGHQINISAVVVDYFSGVRGCKVFIENKTGYLEYLGFLPACSGNVSAPMYKRGNYSLYLTALDNRFNENTTNITIMINDAPSFLTMPINDSVYEDNYYNSTIKCSDFDNDSLIYGINNSRIFLNKTTGLLQWVPGNEDVGLHWFITNCTDGINTTAQVNSLNVINVNDPPLPPPILLPNQTQLWSGMHLIIWNKSVDIDPPPNNITYDVELFNTTAFQRLATHLNALNLSLNTSVFTDNVSYRVRIRAFDDINYSDWNYSVIFGIDNTNPSTTDNLSNSTDYYNSKNWHLNQNVTVNLTAYDNLAGINAIYVCYYNFSGPACTDFTSYLNSSSVYPVLSCPSNSLCQYKLRYYSTDNSVPNNVEPVKETPVINILMGSTAQNLSAYNCTVKNSTLINSRCFNSVVINSTITDSTITNSINSSYILNSIVDDSFIKGSKVVYSVVDPSTIINSIIINSTVINSTKVNSYVLASYNLNSELSDSNEINSSLYSVVAHNTYLESSSLCPMEVFPYSTIINNVLLEGSIKREFMYYDPFNVSYICQNFTPQIPGRMYVMPAITQPDKTVIISYEADSSILSIYANASSVNNNSVIELKDDGIFPDNVAGDGIYTATLTPRTGVSGDYIITAIINTKVGNTLHAYANLTIDTISPFCSIMIDNGSMYTNNPVVTVRSLFYDNYALKGCSVYTRELNSSLISSCQEFNIIKLESEGNDSVYMYIEDKAGNNYTCNDSIILDTTPPFINITWPEAGALTRGVFYLNFSIADLNPAPQRPLISIDGSSPQPTTSMNYHLINTTALEEGSHTLTLTAEDLAHNKGSASLLFSVDNTPEPVTIVYPYNNSFIMGLTSVIIDAADYVSFVRCSLINLTGSYNTLTAMPGEYEDNSPIDGWKCIINSTSFADGDYTLQVKAYERVFFLFDSYIAQSNITLHIDNTPPQAPTNLAVYDNPDNDGRITITFNQSLSADVNYYEIHRSSSPDFIPSGATCVAKINNTNYTELLPDGTYYYRVIAVDYSGKKSAPGQQNWTVVDTKTPLGYITVTPKVAKNNDTLKFVYYGDNSGYNVVVNVSVFDSLGGTATLNDKQNGLYEGEYVISMSNSRPDNTYVVPAIITDPNNNQIIVNTTLVLDNTPPTASMTINNIGETGFQQINPEYTAVRSVILSLNYSDNVNVTMCRFRESTTAWSSLEPCRNSREFLLTEDNGLKTVFAELFDSAGNSVVINDTIYLNKSGVGLDVTPPLAPEVVDEGEWTNNDYISVSWHGAYDRESDLLHIPLVYEVRLTNGTDVVPWTYVGSNNSYIFTNLSLVHNNTYMACVRVINSVGMTNESCSDGITADLKGAGLIITSSTHNTNLSYNSTTHTWFSSWSNKTTVKFEVVGNDTLSGVSAFSYIISKTWENVDFVPEIFQPSFNVTFNLSSGVWYFRVRARDSADNWGGIYTYVVKIDTSPGPPRIYDIRPVGFTVEDNPELFIRTSENAQCSYTFVNDSSNCSATSSALFDIDGGREHSSILHICNGFFRIRFNCTDFSGQYNDNNYTSFTVNTGLIPTSVIIEDISPSRKFTGATLYAKLNVSYNGFGLGGLGNDIDVYIDNNLIRTTIEEMPGGQYLLTFKAPLNEGTHTLKVQVRGVSDSRDFDVVTYSFTVRYHSPQPVTPKIINNTVYTTQKKFTIGLASPKGTVNYGSNMLEVESELPASYIILTRPTSKIYAMTENSTFEDLPLPRFGLKTDDDNYLLGAKLNLDNIYLTSLNLPEGKYYLIIENKGKTPSGATNITIRIKK